MLHRIVYQHNTVLLLYLLDIACPTEIIFELHFPAVLKPIDYDQQDVVKIVGLYHGSFTFVAQA